MKIKFGGVYRTRAGSRVEIISDDEHLAYPFNGDNGRSYTCDGTEFSTFETDHDLIAEWQDEPTPAREPAPAPESPAELAARLGIKITYVVGDMTVIYDGAGG